MKVNEPIGSPEWGAFFVRVTVGLFFVFKGLNEFQHAPIPIQAFGVFKSMPQHVSTLLGIMIPYLEIISGAFILVGFWTTVASGIATVVALFLFYTSGHSFFVGEGTRIFNKDLIIAAGALSLLYSGAGALSFDGAKKS